MKKYQFMSRAYSRLQRKSTLKSMLKSTPLALPSAPNGQRSLLKRSSTGTSRRNRIAEKPGYSQHPRPRNGCVTGKERVSTLPLYPLDMSPLLMLSGGHLDQHGVLCCADTAASADARSALYHPSNIAQYALAHWNAYLLKGAEAHRTAFLQQVDWLLEREVRLSRDVAVWPVPFAVPEYHAPAAWASASVQGYVVSALTRAYQLTGSEPYLQAARRAVGAFELDILDGGISAPIGEDGLFFEEVAVYPAAHILNGCLLALLGLHDYVGVTQDGRIELLMERCMKTLHTMLSYFDTGYWSRYDLLSGRLASEFYHTLHTTLLGILGRYTHCNRCLALAARWQHYTHNALGQLRYWLVSHIRNWWDEQFTPWLRARLFASSAAAPHALPHRVCVPLPLLPDVDRTRDTLSTVAHVMESQWKMSYLIQHERSDHPSYRRFHPWRFPGLLLYCWHGGLHLFRLLRQGERYHLLLPQDSIVSAAFAGLLGKLAGVRVVCMLQHPQMVWSTSPLYRLAARFLSALTVRCCDQFLLTNAELVETYRSHLNVRPDRILHSGLLVDMTRFAALDRKARLRLRIGRGLSPGAVLIALVHRSSHGNWDWSCKNVHTDMRIALDGVAQALRALPAEMRTRIRVLIAGDPGTHEQITSEITRARLKDVCMLWGEATTEEVTPLLGMADIFLSVGSHAGDGMIAVLEAMAAGCAIVATRSSLSDARLLAEGRGIGVLPDNATEIGIALADLCKDRDLCRHMGRNAKAYVARHHSIQMLQRNLLRASFFAPSYTV